MEIRQITPGEYEAFGKDRENWTFLNSLPQAKRLQQMYWEVEFLGGFENGQLTAASLVAKKPALRFFKYAYVPRGFFLDWKDTGAVNRFTKALAKYLKKDKVIYLTTNPYFNLQERDQNGKIVEGGDNRFYVRDNLKAAGFYHKHVAPGYNELRESYYMSVLDLKGRSFAQLLKDMDQQTRWSINRAAKYSLDVRPVKTGQDYEDFVKVMIHTGKRNNFEVESVDFYKNIMEVYGDKADLILAYLKPDNYAASQQKIIDESNVQLEQAEQKLAEVPGSKKFLKKKKVLLEDIERAQKNIEEAKELKEKYGDEILLAASMFLRTDRELVYLYSGAYDYLMKFNAPYAIHEYELKKAVDLGMETYNFYGIAGNFEKEQEGYSLFDFKRGFGCRVVELPGDFVYPVNKPVFEMYRKMKPELFRFES
jgi:peptidoglycan pentaglycine glycine transferase (the second and third glycine)